MAGTAETPVSDGFGGPFGKNDALKPSVARFHRATRCICRAGKPGKRGDGYGLAGKTFRSRGTVGELSVTFGNHSNRQ